MTQGSKWKRARIIKKEQKQEGHTSTPGNSSSKARTRGSENPNISGPDKVLLDYFFFSFSSATAAFSATPGVTASSALR